MGNTQKSKYITLGEGGGIDEQWANSEKIFKFVIFWSSEYQVDALSPSQKKIVMNVWIDILKDYLFMKLKMSG